MSVRNDPQMKCLSNIFRDQQLDQPDESRHVRAVFAAAISEKDFCFVYRFIFWELR